MRTGSLLLLAAAALAVSSCEEPASTVTPEIDAELSRVGSWTYGFLTEAPPQAHLLVQGSMTPLATAGDIMPGGEQLVGVPDGIGVWGRGRFMNMYMNHEIADASRVSRFVVDTKHPAIHHHEYVIDGTEGYNRLCSAEWVDAGDGFAGGYFFTGEESTDGVQLAIDRGGRVTKLPWIGRFAHENQISVPGFRGHAVVLNFDDRGGRGVGRAGADSELYMYAARSSRGVLDGRGQLYVFAADDPSILPNDLSVDVSIGGHWVPVPEDIALDPVALNAFADEEGVMAFPFIRLEDGFYDKRNDAERGTDWRDGGGSEDEAGPNHGPKPAAYFFDTGRSSVTDDDGTPIDPWGSIYRVEFQDPSDPAGPATLTLLGRSTGPSDMWASPDNGDMTADGTIMLQEDPANGPWEPAAGRRAPGIFALQLGSNGTLVDPYGTKVAEVTGGDCSDAGPGDCWETSGIVDASQWFGRGAWIFDVQAHDEPVDDCPDCVEDGQLLLMKVSR